MKLPMPPRWRMDSAWWTSFALLLQTSFTALLGAIEGRGEPWKDVLAAITFLLFMAYFSWAPKFWDKFNEEDGDDDR